MRRTARVTRTVVIKSIRLPRKVFRVLVELEGMYRNMVEQLLMYAVRSVIRSFTRLKVLKYREMRRLYPQLPSHYVGLAERDYPEVKKVSIWLDDHLWKLSGLTYIRIATHKGWVTIELEPHR